MLFAMRNYILVSGIALAALGAAALAAAPAASEWEIGPVIRGKNYSVGMPLRPVPARKGWSFDFPHSSRAAGHVHYVTFRPESLVENSRNTVRYRVDANRSTRFVPQEHPDMPATVSLFLQREGDNWTAKGRHAFFRWYAPAHTVQQIAPGVHEMIVDLRDPAWVSVLGGRTASDNPEAFRSTLQNTGRIGLVFGSTAARGHGVFATAPARFELLSFEIE